jgi:hypothetical protein
MRAPQIGASTACASWAKPVRLPDFATPSVALLAVAILWIGVWKLRLWHPLIF